MPNKSRFFHGFLSSKKASYLLQEAHNVKKHQCYLVRFSEGEVGGFYLSFVDDGGRVTDERITNKNGTQPILSPVLIFLGKWCVETLLQDFESWKKAISACKTAWGLKKVLSGSPYENILKKASL